MILEQEQGREEKAGASKSEAPPLLLAGEDDSTVEPHILRGID